MAEECTGTETTAAADAWWCTENDARVYFVRLTALR
jgi:hypothetical protein